jgi:uncharacterized protein YndB with AHSA1/START domain
MRNCPVARLGKMCNDPVAHSAADTRKESALAEDRIERETLIEAPLERVWSLVAEPGFWAVVDPANVAGTVAREGESMVATHDDGDFPVRVEKVEPPTYVAYRWASAFPGSELSDDNTTLVEFTLTPEGGNTRLRVVESGFSALRGTEDVRRKAVEDNTGGWAEVIGALKARAEQPSA